VKILKHPNTVIPMKILLFGKQEEAGCGEARTASFGTRAMRFLRHRILQSWIPACAGMTDSLEAH
jgi:hypothetical protein